MRLTTLTRTAIVVGAATAAVLLGAGPAAAHVTVSSPGATQGGFAKLTFRVPNESDTASTVKLEVTFPTDTPIASVSIKPVTGWTAATEKARLAQPIQMHGSEVTEAISKITWTASGPAAGVAPGQFQEFDVSAGPLPAADQVVFKALQTYSDQNIVRWIEEPVAGGEEPEHPAPVLPLAKASADGEHGAPGAGTSGASEQQSSAPVAAGDTSDGGSALGTGLGIAALVVALAGLAVALLAWRRTGTVKAG